MQPSRVGLTLFSKNISIDFAANGAYPDVEVPLASVVNYLRRVPALLVCVALGTQPALRLHASQIPLTGPLR
jgi:hypothetical protein